MKARFNRVKQFLTRDIWEFSTSTMKNDLKGKSEQWLKTFMLTAKIFVKKEMWIKDVAALTYASLMALIPVMAVMFVIARGFGYTAIVESWLADTFHSQPVVAQTIVGFVHNYIENTQSNYIIGVGALVMIYTTIVLMQKIERTFDEIWHTEERTWTKKLAEYPTIFICFVFIIILSSSFNVSAEHIFELVEDYVDFGEYATALASRFLTFFSMFLFFMFCYCAIPNTYVRKRNTIIPSLVAGVSMTALQYGYFYVQGYLASYNVIYGSLAALPLFLLWLQITWTICVMGTILCYVNQNLCLFDGDKEYDALCYNDQMDVCRLVMHKVCEHFDSGQKDKYTPKALHEELGIPQQLINKAVAKLTDASLLLEITDSGGKREETSCLMPFENTALLTDERMISALNAHGDSL